MVPVRAQSIAIFLLLVLLVPALPLDAPADATGHLDLTAPPLVLEDPVGDPGPLGLGVADNPAMAALYQHVDITRIELGHDDASTFRLDIKVAGWDPVVTLPAQAAALGSIGCNAQWTYAHDKDDLTFHYVSGFRAAYPRVPGDPPESFSNSHIFMYRDENRWTEWHSSGGFNGLEVTFDKETTTFQMTLHKTSFPVWPGARPPSLGDTLILQAVSCQTGEVPIRDDVQVDEDSRYDFAFPGPNGTVSVYFTNDGPPEQIEDINDWQRPFQPEGATVSSVGPGERTALPITVVNHADTRRLVQLDALMPGSDGDGWNLTLAPSVMLGAGEERTFNLLVTPPADAVPGEARPIHIVAQVTGEDTLSLAPRILRVTPVLAHDQSTFHIHLKPYPNGDLVDEVFTTAIPRYLVATSLLEEIEGYPNDPAPLGEITNGFTGYQMDPLVRAAHLDPDVPTKVKVSFQGDPERQVSVGMTLTGEESGTLFQFTKRVPADGTTEIDVPLQDEEALVLPAGERLYFYMSINTVETGPESVNEIAFDPSGSSFTLPVLETDQDFVVTDGRFLPTLALARGEERLAYLNPGQEYAFDLVMTNEGVDTDDVTIEIEPVNTTGWEVQAMPGSTYRLNAGNSTPFAVVVHAPDDAAEGEQGRFDVRVRSKSDPDVHTRMRVSVIVTSGVDLESKPYEEREGQAPPLTEDSRGSPAAALLPVLFLGSLLAAVRRGRRTHSGMKSSDAELMQ